jgi:hypothetical protein
MTVATRLFLSLLALACGSAAAVVVIELARSVLA